MTNEKNEGRVELRFQPADLAGDHPLWDKVLQHCGADLDESLKKQPWAVRNGIETGEEYLRLWIACMLREPFESLPYLFLFGPQCSGKSILHEAISLLIAKGAVSADRALVSKLNGELDNAVLCYVEETDVNPVGSWSYNKLKDWVTGRGVFIHTKRQCYTQDNSTHWIQCSNDLAYAPVSALGRRITMICVAPLKDGEEIPKNILLAKLKEEAPHFLRTLLDLRLPTVEGRLRIPIIETPQKRQAEDNL